jgi:hypothetical protein
VSDFPIADQAWFEMASIRRRRLSDAVWVPLRLAEWIGEVGRIGYEGYRTEFFGLGSIAVPLARRANADKLGWSEIGIGYRHGVLASNERYTPAEVYQYRDGDDLGIELVLEQGFEGAAPPVWHINQDLVMALGLLRENDEWIRPSEDYCVVARLRRNADGRPIACEIKNEFLRDYLAARSFSANTRGLGAVLGARNAEATIEEYLTDQARSRVRSVFYEPVMAKVGLTPKIPHHRKLIGGYLETISKKSHHKYGVILTVLVHQKTAGTTRPGKGFFKLADELGYSCDDKDQFVSEQTDKVLSVFLPERDARGRRKAVKQ